MPSRLACLGIDKSRPGFYDDPLFLAAEAKDPTLLEAYAGYVNELDLDDAYRTDARRKITESAIFLHDELVRDGLKGGCIDVSVALGRFLERQGVWNYVVKGGVSMHFAPETGLGRRYHWVFDSKGDPQAKAGHAWVYAPPFQVVDLTLGQQHGVSGGAHYLREPVLGEQAERIEPDIEAVFDDHYREHYSRQLGHPMRLHDLRVIDPGLLKKLKTQRSWRIARSFGSLQYVGHAVTASDKPFEQVDRPLLNGKSGWELWLQFKR